ncbi:MAG: (2Fe-2S) ferredoxin domain-containing protein [Ruminococcus sp.]|nr:(2Fe-2S) ferredoxin domain-containing protein [Ruminococcus sp.]MCD8328068.1 (2Fe-2S) ferredoxin domain-containing protein [Ruminococcus sp.]
MKVTICIGSSCHLKGSRQVVEALQNHVKEANLQDKVELGGAFCIGNCQNGVSVTVDGVVHSVNPDNVDSFFENEIKSKV